MIRRWTAMMSSVHNATDATHAVSIRCDVHCFAIAAKSYRRCTAMLYFLFRRNLLSLRHLCHRLGRSTKTEVVCRVSSCLWPSVVLWDSIRLRLLLISLEQDLLLYLLVFGVDAAASPFGWARARWHAEQSRFDCAVLGGLLLKCLGVVARR